MKIYKGAAVDGNDETETKESRCAVEMKYSSQEHMFTQDIFVKEHRNRRSFIEASTGTHSSGIASTRLNQLRRLYVRRLFGDVITFYGSNARSIMQQMPLFLFIYLF